MMLRCLMLAALGAVLSGGATAHDLPTKSDLLVQGLEDIYPQFDLFEGTMYAGRLPVKNGERSGEMMFWLFAPNDPVSKDSIQLWVRRDETIEF